MVRHRERGDAAETDSFFTSVAYTPFSLRTSLDLPLPERPVHAVAHERQEAAVLCREEHSKGRVPVSLDTATCELSASGSSELSVHDAHHYSSRNSVAMSPGVPLLTREAGCGQEAGIATTLHWLKQWGPLLTELLCEAAKNDADRVMLKQERMCHGAGSRNGSSTGGNSSSFSTNASVCTMPGSRDRKNQRQRRSPCANKGFGWRAYCQATLSVSTLKKQRGGAAATRPGVSKGARVDPLTVGAGLRGEVVVTTHRRRPARRCLSASRPPRSSRSLQTASSRRTPQPTARREHRRQPSLGSPSAKAATLPRRRPSPLWRLPP